MLRVVLRWDTLMIPWVMIIFNVLLIVLKLLPVN